MECLKGTNLKSTEDIHVCKFCKSSIAFWCTSYSSCDCQACVILDRFYFLVKGWIVSFFIYKVNIIKMRSDKSYFISVKWLEQSDIFTSRIFSSSQSSFISKFVLRQDSQSLYSFGNIQNEGGSQIFEATNLSFLTISRLSLQLL